MENKNGVIIFASLFGFGFGDGRYQFFVLKMGWIFPIVSALLIAKEFENACYFKVVYYHYISAIGNKELQSRGIIGE